MTRTLEQLTALLRRAGIDPETGLRTVPMPVDDSLENIARIVAHDVAVNWPRIEAERGGM